MKIDTLILSNTITLSLSGDILGPLILQHLESPVSNPEISYLKYTDKTFLLQSNCFDSVSQLSLLLSHYHYRRHSQLGQEPGLEERMAATFQQILSCKHPQGGFTVHFNTR